MIFMVWEETLDGLVWRRATADLEMDEIGLEQGKEGRRVEWNEE